MNAFLNGVSRQKNGLKIRLPFAIGLNVNEMAESAGLTVDESCQLEIMLLMAFTQIPDNDYPAQIEAKDHLTIVLTFDQPAREAIQEALDADGNILVAAQEAVPARQGVKIDVVEGMRMLPIPGGMFAHEAFSDLDLAKGYLLELSRAQQSKPMNVSNIKNYFAGKGMLKVNSRLILTIVQASATAFSVLKGDYEVDALIEMSPWMKYRLSASSTPTLVKKFLDESTTLRLGIFSDHDIALVDAALHDLEDLDKSKRIPRNMIIATHSYLRAMGSLPDDWYQGERAVQEGSSVYANSWFFASRKFKELGVSKDKLESASSKEQLNLILRSDLVTVQAPPQTEGSSSQKPPDLLWS